KSTVLNEQRHLAAIIEGSEDAIITKDLDGRILSWNPAAEEIYGYNAEEVIGRLATMLLPKGREDEERKILSRVRAGESVAHFASLRRRKSGEVFHASLTVSPLRSDAGEIVAASVIARDVTVQKRVQDALRASNE